MTCGYTYFPLKEISSQLKAKSAKKPHGKGSSKANDYEKEYMVKHWMSDVAVRCSFRRPRSLLRARFSSKQKRGKSGGHSPVFFFLFSSATFLKRREKRMPRLSSLGQSLHLLPLPKVFTAQPFPRSLIFSFVSSIFLIAPRREMKTARGMKSVLCPFYAKPFQFLLLPFPVALVSECFA